MNEIEKMYENAGVNKIGIKRCSGIKQGICLHNCNECESFGYKYPPFTAEKQIEMIKWLANKFSFFAIEYNFQKWSSSNGLITGFYKNSLEESIADYINNLWQDLTETEREEIRKILKG